MISAEATLEFWISERSIENRDRLVHTYSYLCSRGARKFLRSGLERCDLEQVATIGLIKACDRFDPELRTPFEAYAWLFIMGELMHYVRDHERIVRPPRKLRALEKRYMNTVDRLTMERGCEPRDVEVAEVMEVCVRTVLDLKECRSRAVADPLESLNLSARRSGDETDAVLDGMLLQKALGMLNDVEQKIICGVYVRGLSQHEIACILGYSQRHVSRLHRSALQKMLPVWVH